MKFGQILVCCMINISNMFFVQCWGLDPNSKPFYDFIKMIQQDVSICSGEHLPILIVPYSSPFQTYGTLES